MARGALKQRSKGSWTIILDLGYQVDPTTGKRRRKQRWETVRGTKRQADERLAELLNQHNRGQLVDPSKQTFGEWLQYWLTNRIEPRRRLRTTETYQSIISRHLRPELGGLLLQELNFTHLEEYYRHKGKDGLAAATLEIHHAIISGALKWAQRKELVYRNVAQLVDNRPSATRSGGVEEHCWTPAEAKQFLRTAEGFGTQPAAFYAMALDSGARKGELCGLTWKNIDLEDGKITIVQQLVKTGKRPIFGPPKQSRPRSIQLTGKTVSRLRNHRQAQSELKMRNRKHYRDFGLVFAREWSHLTRGRDSLGSPLQMNSIGQREFKRITEKAGLRTIKFHGLRHTSATLLLAAKVPVQVVSERLGHKRVEITMNVYQHVLPDMQQEAARKIESLLF